MAKPADTPMMVQYHEIKAQYPDAFVFYRLGDFYELFEEDAIQGAKLLELTLTARNKNSENPVPMAGIPHHAAQNYIDILGLVQINKTIIWRPYYRMARLGLWLILIYQLVS